jgi:dTDP-4-amino-4,6-dideoxygalactose transaminase
MVQSPGTEAAVQTMAVMEVVGSHAIMNKERHYCGPPGITIGDLWRKASPDGFWGQANNRRVIYTHKGRCGLGLLCQHWGLKPGDEVLMPAYNCGSEIDPFLVYQLSVVFYRVDLEARIDFTDITRRVTKGTRVIYVTHYFGWPQDTQTLSDFCQSNNIYLIEDCALSLFSNPVDYPLGLLGDAAIYSFPKTLPVPDGGALTGSFEIEQFTQSPPCKTILRNMLPLIKRTALRLSETIGLFRFLPHWLIRSIGHNRNAASITPAGLPEMPQSYYFDKSIENLAISKMTRRILRRTCAENLVQRRRENYSVLYHTVEKSDRFRPLHEELPDGVCPLYLPVVVENREAVSIRLNEMGIVAVQWWAGFHREFDWAGFPEAKYLKEHVLAIPVHQQLNRRNVDYLCSSLKLADMEN